jgi:hypothetical protein
VPSVACAAITKLGHRVLSVCLANYTLGWMVQFFRSPSLPFSLCWANCRYFGHQVTITPRLISSEDQVNVCKSTLGPHLSKRWAHILPHCSHTWQPPWLCLPSRWSSVLPRGSVPWWLFWLCLLERRASVLPRATEP